MIESLNRGGRVPNKAATINRHIATIKHMFTKAVEWEMVEEDVLKRITKVKLLKENNRRLRYLSKEECQGLLRECDSHIRPIVTVAHHTGMRKGEILGLTWDRIDLKHGLILLEQDDTKNGERREIPVNGAVRAALQSVTRRPDVPYVFYYVCCDDQTKKETVNRCEKWVQWGLQKGRDKGFSLSRPETYLCESPGYGRAGPYDGEGTLRAQDAGDDSQVFSSCTSPQNQGRRTP